MQRTPIHDLVDKARAGENPYVIAKLESGWAVAFDQPFLKGHCVLLSDPVVFSLNDLPEDKRMIYSRDCARIGDALMKVLSSYRINYETLCNGAQALHTHIIPRYMNEPEAKRKERAAIAYPSSEIKKLDAENTREFLTQMREALSSYRD